MRARSDHRREPGSSYASMLIMRDEFVKTIEEIRKNKSICRRCSSHRQPGGSGYASDDLAKTRELDEESPSSSAWVVAGSGGYIVLPGALDLCGADNHHRLDWSVLGIFPKRFGPADGISLVDEMKLRQPRDARLRSLRPQVGGSRVDPEIHAGLL